MTIAAIIGDGLTYKARTPAGSVATLPRRRIRFPGLPPELGLGIWVGIGNTMHVLIRTYY